MIFVSHPYVSIIQLKLWHFALFVIVICYMLVFTAFVVDCLSLPGYFFKMSLAICYLWTVETLCNASKENLVRISVDFVCDLVILLSYFISRWQIKPKIECRQSAVIKCRFLCRSPH